MSKRSIFLLKCQKIHFIAKKKKKKKKGCNLLYTKQVSIIKVQFSHV